MFLPGGPFRKLILWPRFHVYSPCISQQTSSDCSSLLSDDSVYVPWTNGPCHELWCKVCTLREYSTNCRFSR